MKQPLSLALSGLFAQADPAPAMPVLHAPAPPCPEPKRRRKLWELEARHHCPIVGTCLSAEELAKFARRFGYAAALRDEYSLHAAAVSRAGTRNEVSQAVHRHLERKYQRDVQRFEHAGSDAQVLALWQERLRAGEAAGSLWAALTHRSASADTRAAVYADVHMLSHRIGAGLALDARRLAVLNEETAVLQQSLERERRERSAAEAAWRDQARSCEAELARLRRECAELAALRARVRALESGAALAALERRVFDLSAANAQLLAAPRRAEQLEARLAMAAEQLRALRAERDRLACERDALGRLFSGQDANEPACALRCGDHDGASPGACVLYVGGRAALVPQYRKLAQRLGVRLLHHDGGQEESVSRLPELINGADAVVCPTDCVSHAAYYLLKRHCKRTGKPCLLFRGAGVSSFALALSRVASGRVSLAARESAPAASAA